jgi:branched-chain amino acid transport system ATP-binding protein
MSPPVLTIGDVSVRFGGILALNNVNITVAGGTIHAIIGPNGAGKSTLINAITGIYAPSSGRIEFLGQRIDGRPVHEIARRGIGRTFQNAELFGELTASENVMVGLGRHINYGLAEGALHFGRFDRSEAKARDDAMAHLAFVGLADEADAIAANLPFGKQRRLELARALATRPQLLLLDEPAAGLRSSEIAGLNEILLSLRTEQRLTIVVIDHVMALVMAISDRISVLDFGNKIAEGTPDEVRASPEVVKAYFGEGRANVGGA